MRRFNSFLVQFRRFHTSSSSSRPPPTIFACVIDGYDPSYTSGLEGKLLAPTLSTLATQAIAKAAMPTFTNVNNVSILTGTTPKTHGIAGNFIYNELQRTEIPMVQSEFIRANSLLASAYNHGFDIVIVTAKEKLRKLLSHQLPIDALTATDNLESADDIPSVTCISLESAAIDAQTQQNNSSSSSTSLVRQLLLKSRSTVPTIYDPEISIAVIEMGNALVQYIQSKRRTPRPIIAFLSTTDYVQHKYAPFSEGANSFYKLLDKAVSDLLSTHKDCIFALTADHGMSRKHDPESGNLNIIYLEHLLNTFDIPNRTILPITDAHIVHHASLGGYANIHIGSCHAPRTKMGNEDPSIRKAVIADEEWMSTKAGQVLPQGLEIKMNMQSGSNDVAVRLALSFEERRAYENKKEALIERAITILKSQEGIHRVFRKQEASEFYSLPIDRIGDLVAVSKEDYVLGKTPSHHDLKKVERLRSHGGESEVNVPFKVNKSLKGVLDESTFELLESGNAPSNLLLPVLFALTRVNASENDV
jgi:phosphonoacetate hydrolase